MSENPLNVFGGTSVEEREETSNARGDGRDKQLKLLAANNARRVEVRETTSEGSHGRNGGTRRDARSRRRQEFHEMREILGRGGVERESGQALHATKALTALTDGLTKGEFSLIRQGGWEQKSRGKDAETTLIEGAHGSRGVGGREDAIEVHASLERAHTHEKTSNLGGHVLMKDAVPYGLVPIHFVLHKKLPLALPINTELINADRTTEMFDPVCVHRDPPRGRHTKDVWGNRRGASPEKPAFQGIAHDARRSRLDQEPIKSSKDCLVSTYEGKIVHDGDRDNFVGLGLSRSEGIFVIGGNPNTVKQGAQDVTLLDSVGTLHDSGDRAVLHDGEVGGAEAIGEVDEVPQRLPTLIKVCTFEKKLSVKRVEGVGPVKTHCDGGEDGWV
jgi:hypothetical protein